MDDFQTILEKQTQQKVSRQINLPFRRAVEISIRSLSIRFWRSLVTSAVVFLAIGFLTYMLATQDMSLKKLQEEAKKEKITTTLQTELERAGTQRWWVTIISMTVALIGITNTLLMSVAERYREIGTMKCLGALDRFVVELFLIEAVVMGAIGSGVGSLLGLGSALFPLFRSRELQDVALPWSNLGWIFLIGLGFGLALTLVAAAFPAYVASRMAPAEAMRTEV